jgi:hypothetical protein
VHRRSILFQTFDEEAYNRRMLSLLGLFRFETVFESVAEPSSKAEHARTTMEANIGALMLQAQTQAGRVIAYEHQQLVLYIHNAEWGLPILKQLLNLGAEHGFNVYGALVQPVATKAKPEHLNEFTERTVETLYRIHAAVEANEVGLSPKMMSLIDLSCPQYAAWFLNPGERSSPVRVMRPG